MGGDEEGAMGRGRWGGGGNGEGETGMGKWGVVEVLARAGSGEVETGRVRLGGVNGERATGRGRQGRGQMGGGEEVARGTEISQMDMVKYLGGHMECFGGIILLHSGYLHREK